MGRWSAPPGGSAVGLVLRFVLRFFYGFVEHMLGMNGFVHRLFELLMTVALVGAAVRLGALLVFVSGFVMRVVPILAGPRWVLRSYRRRWPSLFHKPLCFTTSHARHGHCAGKMESQPRN